MTLGTASVRAADVTGTWSSEMTTPDGNSFPLTFTFKQEGATLTGTVQGPMGDPMDIVNGKIDGDKFSFDVSFNGMTIHHNCTVVERRRDQDDDKVRQRGFSRHGADAEAREACAAGRARRTGHAGQAEPAAAILGSVNAALPERLQKESLSAPLWRR